MAVDLGTATTLVYVRGRGSVNEPEAWSALNTTHRPGGGGRVTLNRIDRRTPGNHRRVRPLKDGVIADFVYVRQSGCSGTSSRGPPADPDGQAEDRRRGAGGITASSSPRSRRPPQAGGAGSTSSRSRWPPPRIGPGLPVNEPTGNMVGRHRGGTTEVAVISLGGIGDSAVDQDRRGRARPRHHHLRQRRAQPDLERADRRGDQGWRSARRSPAPTSRNARSGARTWSAACPKTILSAAAEIRQRGSKRPINPDHRRGQDRR